jgi:hypothetical protein
MAKCSSFSVMVSTGHTPTQPAQLMQRPWLTSTFTPAAPTEA